MRRVLASVQNTLDDDWNEDLIDDLEQVDYKEIIVYSRDWTIETIFNQIRQGNIDLNPKFQRRNAWTDEKRSKLIESLILGLPVPEIVLAENPQKKKAFIVIDGKQRLLTIAGFMAPDKFKYWTKPKLSKLTQKNDLLGKTYKNLQEDIKYEDLHREFLNADMRCTIVSNYKNSDILYDIFYRLNTGSVPLSSQELRQVLNKGPFADYLYEITKIKQPVHQVLDIPGPDPRLRDIEIILRYICISLFGHQYSGNLKKFLDVTMGTVNDNWIEWEEKVKQTYSSFNQAIKNLSEVFGDQNIGKKFINNTFQRPFNKVLFEVQVFYFKYLDDNLSGEINEKLLQGFEKLCVNREFTDTLAVSTKDVSRYKTRYKHFREYVNEATGMAINADPLV